MNDADLESAVSSGLLPGVQYDRPVALYVHVDASGQVHRRYFSWDLEKPDSDVLLAHWREELEALVTEAASHHDQYGGTALNVVLTADDAQGRLLIVRGVLEVLEKLHRAADMKAAVLVHSPAGRGG